MTLTPISMATATATRERPILFSGEMVRAILEGRKTQTRRVVRPQPTWIESSGRWLWPIPPSKVNPGCCTEVVTASREWWEYLTPNQRPYQVGDWLWVREACGVRSDLRPYVIYRADHPDVRMPFEHIHDNTTCWRPSFLMPRWASRISLEVTEVRAERLQAITEADAQREGLQPSIMGHGYPVFRTEALEKFRNLWNRLNGPRGYGWDADPWVWVVSFSQAAERGVGR